MKKSLKKSKRSKALFNRVAYIFIAAIFIVNFCLVYTVLAEDTTSDISSVPASDSSNSTDNSSTDSDSGVSDNEAVENAADVDTDSNSQSDNNTDENSGSDENTESDTNEQPASESGEINANDSEEDQGIITDESLLTISEVDPEAELLAMLPAIDLSPVITINGMSTINLTVGDVYVDAGATASDDIDGDITGLIITEDNVWTHIADTYTVDYFVTDSAGHTTQTSRTVIVSPGVGNLAPQADNLSVNLKENTGISINLSGSDPDQKKTIKGAPIYPMNIVNYDIVGQPAFGTLSNLEILDDSRARVIYKPNDNYYGPDSFTYKVQDNEGAWSDSATVSITINNNSVCTTGDLSGDDKIDVNDSLIMKSMFVNEIRSDLSADFDQNGILEVSDFVRLHQLISEKQISPAVTDAERGNCSLKADITYSKDGGATFTSKITVAPGDTLIIKAKFNKIILVQYRTEISISHNLLLPTEMQRYDMDSTTYSFLVPDTYLTSASVSLVTGQDPLEINILINSGRNFNIARPASEGGSSGGGGVNYCADVVYGFWSECSNDLQTRDISSQLPTGCQLTSGQLAAMEQTCTNQQTTINPEINLEQSNNEENSSIGGQVLGVKIWEVGSLIRTPDFKIFVVKNDMKLWHIKTLKELAKSYFGLTIWNVPVETLAQYIIINF